MPKLHYVAKAEGPSPYCKVRRDHHFDKTTEINDVTCLGCIRRYVREAKRFRPSEDVSHLIERLFTT